MALKLGRKPSIINSGQGYQFTSQGWAGALAEHGIEISMVEKERCQDTIYIERFWRSLTHEAVSLNDDDSVDGLAGAR